MHQTSVRFGDQTWQQIKALAEREGVPTSQVIREGTIAHMATVGERRRNDDLEAEVADLRRQLDAVARMVRRRRL